MHQLARSEAVEKKVEATAQKRKVHDDDYEEKREERRQVGPRRLRPGHDLANLLAPTDHCRTGED